MDYKWSVYYEPSTYKGAVTIEKSSASKCKVLVPPDASDKIIHVILEITDNPHYIELGYIDVFLITNKPVRKGKKKRDLLKLIMKYLQTNNLVKISHD